jgi:CheY-like chemotaxis protein
MAADGAFGVEHGKAPDGARSGRDPQSLVSTRLTRELIAADARSDQDRDDPSARIARLLDAALSGLSVSLGAILRYQPAPAAPSCLAAQGVAAAAIELLEGRGGSDSLAQRACAERRVFLLDRASREPLMSALRAEVPELATAVVIPLFDRGLAVATIVLGAIDPRPLQASSLRLLAPAFHLFGVLLSPGRSGTAGTRVESGAETADQERYLVEIEELGNLLRESRETARQAAERGAAAEAEHRVEVEGYRARIAELEAAASRVELESSLRRDLESAYSALVSKVEDRDARIAVLEDEVRHLQTRMALLQDERDAAVVVRLEPDAEAGGDDGAAIADPHLQEIADAAAAAMSSNGDGGAAAAPEGEHADGTGEAPDGAAPAGEELVVDGSPAAPEAEVAIEGDAGAGEAEAAPLPWHTFGIESDAELREGMEAASQRCGVATWFGGDAVPVARGLVVANLFDPGFARCPEVVAQANADGAGLAYARDPETQEGVELGTVTWLPRPIDAAAARERVRTVVRGKVGGIVIISAQLRELSPMREALSAAGISSSVACDSRQALDLLEIVRQPDALLIDLALDGGQGLAIAASCRTQPDTRDIPLLLLLPREIEPERLRLAGKRTGILAPYGTAEISRMITAALSAR